MLRYFAPGDDAKEGTHCTRQSCQPRVRIPQNNEGAAGMPVRTPRRALIAAFSTLTSLAYSQPSHTSGL